MLFQHMCRQGREAVQVTYELDIVAQDIIDPEGVMPAGDLMRDGGVLPASVSQLIKGRLHLRMANVGHFSDTKMPKAGRLLNHTAKSIFWGSVNYFAIGHIVLPRFLRGLSYRRYGYTAGGGGGAWLRYFGELSAEIRVKSVDKPKEEDELCFDPLLALTSLLQQRPLTALFAN